MEIIEIRIEGAYNPQCIRPTVELSDGKKIMLGYRTDAVDLDAIIKSDIDRINRDNELETPETISDVDIERIKKLHAALKSGSIKDNIIVMDSMLLLVQDSKEPKKINKTLTPLDNPKEVAPDCACIDEICAIVHTPAVKAAYQERIKAERGPVQKTVKVMKPYQRIEMVDGKAVLKTGEEEVDEPVSKEIPVVCEQGKPVIGEDGKQLMHEVPVYE